MIQVRWETFTQFSSKYSR